MSSKEITNSLDVLHKELERLAPAITLVEKAELTVKSVMKIPEQHKQLIHDLEEAEQAHREALKVQFADNSSEIAQNVNKQIKALEAYSKELPQRYQELTDQLSKNDATHKDELKQILQAESEAITESTRSLIETLTGQTDHLKQLVKRTDDQLSEDRKFIEQINIIDFPTRLNSISGHVSNISSGFNNLQNTTSSLKDELIRMERENNAKFDKIQDAMGVNKILLIVAVATTIIALITTIFK